MVAAPAEGPVLRVEHLVKNYGALQVTDDVSIAVADRELVAVIGPNGAGKTSLVHQIAGEITPGSGSVFFMGEDVTRLSVEQRARRGLLRSFQITSVFERFTVLENATLSALSSGAGAWGAWRPLLQRKDLVDRAHAALDSVGLARQASTPVGEISYGERRQLELAMALVAHPRFLLLDEPMAGMSPGESAVIVELLHSLKKRFGILLIEHDMDAVFSLADRITVLVSGRVLFEGTPAEIRAHAGVRSVYLGDESIAGTSP
ncbi:MAG: transporter-related protein [Ramlibacter sp.]|nr:transporter-related protein [Ramlibacter sp.]MDB5911691.1 transporter-related protein [Ramlibacter sp.]